MAFGKRNKVLVVDDDEDMLFLIETTLSNGKFKIFKSRSGKEGIEQAKKILPDIIVMDIMMPELDGIAAVLKLKSTEETKSIPIIMCTAVKEDEDEIVARHLGVADYCRKTPQMEDLRAKIERVLNI
jgi:two-component system alkaline phosphatase synthesis response regulator PhoP